MTGLRSRKWGAGMKKQWWYGLGLVLLLGLGVIIGWQLAGHQQQPAKHTNSQKEAKISKSKQSRQAPQQETISSSSETSSTSSELSASHSENVASSTSQVAVIQSGQAAADLIEQADRNQGADTSQMLYSGYPNEDGTFGVSVRSKAIMQQGGSGTVDLYIVYPDGSYEHAPAYR